MSLAEKLMSLPGRAKNIAFVFFDQEENGLVGARRFAEKIKEDQVEVHSVHTIDQMGWDADGDRAIELEKAPDYLYDIYQRVNIERGFNIQLHRTNVTSTDHTAFRELGFPALGLSEEYVNGDTTPCYHRKCDTYESINFGYLFHATRFWQAVIEDIVTSP